MTLNELIETLEQYRDEMGGDTQVRTMSQPSWPFEYSIRGICSGEDINDFKCQDDDDEEVVGDAVVYLVEGRQLGYGDSAAWDCC